MVEMDAVDDHMDGRVSVLLVCVGGYGNVIIMLDFLYVINMRNETDARRRRSWRSSRWASRCLSFRERDGVFIFERWLRFHRFSFALGEKDPVLQGEEIAVWGHPINNLSGHLR